MDNKPLMRTEVDGFLDAYFPLIAKQGQKREDPRNNQGDLRKPLARLILECGLPRSGAIGNYACPVPRVSDHVAAHDLELGSDVGRSERQALSNAISRINERIAESPIAKRLMLCLHGNYVYGITDPDTIAYVLELQKLPFGTKTLVVLREAILYAFLQAGTESDQSLASKIDSKGFRKVPSRLKAALERAQLPTTAVKALLAKKCPSDSLLHLKTESHEPCAPPLPTKLIGRAEALSTLRRWIVPGRKDSKRRIGLHGLPGVGKTTLLATLVREKAIRTEYGDEIYWVNIGQDRGSENILRDLICRTNNARVGIADGQDFVRVFHDTFSDRQCLIVLDDIWRDEQLRPFKELAGLSCVVALSRNRELLEHSFGEQSLLRVTPLDEGSSQELLASYCRPQTEDTSIIRGIATGCGGLPLALTIAGQMARRIGFDNVREILSRSDLTRIKALVASYQGTRSGYSKEGHVTLFRVIDASVEFLEPHDKRPYLALAVMPEKTSITLSALETLWGLNAGQVMSLVDALADRSLACFEDGALTLHDTLHAYLVCRANRDNTLRAHHHAALCAYADRCVKRGADLFHEGKQPPWWKGPTDGYFEDALIYHLLSTGMPEAAVALLCDSPEWTQRRLERGPSYVLDDVGRTESFLSDIDDPASDSPLHIKLALLRAQILSGPHHVAHSTFELLTLVHRTEEAKRLASMVGGSGALIEATVQISRALRFHEMQDMEMLAAASMTLSGVADPVRKNICAVDLAIEYFALNQIDKGVGLCKEIRGSKGFADTFASLLRELARLNLHREAEEVLAHISAPAKWGNERSKAALIYLQSLSSRVVPSNESLRRIADTASISLRACFELPLDAGRFAAACHAYGLLGLNDIAERSLMEIERAILADANHEMFTQERDLFVLARGYAAIGRHKDARSCVKRGTALAGKVACSETLAELLCYKLAAVAALNDKRSIAQTRDHIIEIVRTFKTHGSGCSALRSLITTLLSEGLIEEAKAVRQKHKELLGSDACHVEMAQAWSTRGNATEALVELEAEKAALAGDLNNPDKADSDAVMCFIDMVIQITSTHPTPGLLRLFVDLCSTQAPAYLMGHKPVSVVTLLIQAENDDLASYFVSVYLRPLERSMPWFLSAISVWARNCQAAGRGDWVFRLILRTEQFCRQEMPGTEEHYDLYAFVPVYLELGKEKEAFRLLEEMSALNVSVSNYGVVREAQYDAFLKSYSFLFRSDRIHEAATLLQYQEAFEDDSEYDDFLVLAYKALQYICEENDHRAVVDRVSSVAKYFKLNSLADALWASLAEICCTYGPIDLAEELLAHVSDKDLHTRFLSVLALRLAKEGRVEEAERFLVVPLTAILDEVKNHAPLTFHLENVMEALHVLGRITEMRDLLEQTYEKWLDISLADRSCYYASFMLEAFFRTGNTLEGLTRVSTIDPVDLFSAIGEHLPRCSLPCGEAPERLFLDLVRLMSFSSKFWQRFYSTLIAEG